MKECKHSNVFIICGRLVLCQPATSYIVIQNLRLFNPSGMTQGQFIMLFFSSPTEKPMPQGPPGGIFGILGVVVVAGLILGVVATICMVYRRGQKPRTETDNDL